MEDAGDGQDEAEPPDPEKPPDPESRMRQLYGFNGLMSNACLPNICCPNIVNPTVCGAFALQDIKPGDVLTCDCALFDYEYDGHAIKICDSPKCHGLMCVFKNLTFTEKIRYLHLVDDDMRSCFFADYPDLPIIESPLPPGIGLKIENDEEKTPSVSLVATKPFKAGQEVFTNQALLVEPDLELRILLHTGGRYFLLTGKDHFLYREDYAEILGFDCFMDHACEPSVSQEYSAQSKGKYTVHALRDIAVGHKLTCDYEKDLDNKSLGESNLTTIAFKCICGSTKCRGTIRA